MPPFHGPLLRRRETYKKVHLQLRSVFDNLSAFPSRSKATRAPSGSAITEHSRRTQIVFPSIPGLEELEQHLRGVVGGEAEKDACLVLARPASGEVG